MMMPIVFFISASAAAILSRVGLLLLVALLLCSSVEGSQVEVCPGEGARYGDHKCNHDPTHRVCAQLLDDTGAPLNWGSSGNFWQITGQEAFQWDSEIRANGGQDWCICMWATAGLIEKAGCDNVHIDCAATDVSYVMKAYTDGGTDLASAHECLQKLCPAQVTDLAELPKSLRGDIAAPASPLSAVLSGNPTTPLTTMVAAVLGASFVLGLLVRLTFGGRVQDRREQEQGAEIGLQSIE